MNTELLDLERIRLDRDLTFDSLAARIGISRRNLFRLFEQPQAQMHKRTRTKIQKFIARHQPRRKKARA
jgi:transcriptional regulator GlxA family with amidase domain